MIIDTSALIAVLDEEEGHTALKTALFSESFLILPAPARVEFSTIARNKRFTFGDRAESLLDDFTTLGMTTLPWDARHATIAADERRRYGKVSPPFGQ